MNAWKFIYTHEDNEGQDETTSRNSIGGNVVNIPPSEAAARVPELQQEGYAFWPTIGQHEDGCPPHFTAEQVAEWCSNNPTWAQH